METVCFCLHVYKYSPGGRAAQVPAASSISVLHDDPDKQVRGGMWVSSLSCLLLLLLLTAATGDETETVAVDGRTSLR